MSKPTLSECSFSQQDEQKNQSSQHQSEPNKIIRKISIVETIKTSHNSLFEILKNKTK